MKERNKANEVELHNSLFSDFRHVAIVVEDMEKAVQHYSSMGIGPFTSLQVREYVNLIGIPDNEALYDIQVKEAPMGSAMLQLVQPGKGKSVYRDFLEKKGEGIQHLGFIVEDINQAEDEIQKFGFKITASGRRADGSGFTYFDNDRIGGVPLVIRQNPSKD
jgi:4-hydroxyphenylpyruvate dioxygenase-like putative hemolysin